MQETGRQTDECVILIKAQPHRSSTHFETVCCAGVTRDRQWRRQYPIPFRILKDDQKFGRWQWITYEHVPPQNDPRRESQKVDSRSIKPTTELRKQERAEFLSPLVKGSTREADEQRDSLVLVRPRAIILDAKEKDREQLGAEAHAHRLLANQLSLLEDDDEVEPLTPCSMEFALRWRDQDNKEHRHVCDDWETMAAFNRFERQYGRQESVDILKAKYEEEYFNAGLVLGFSTHSRRNVEFGARNQWLLVGLIRLDETQQIGLFD